MIQYKATLIILLSHYGNGRNTLIRQTIFMKVMIRKNQKRIKLEIIYSIQSSFSIK